MGKKYANQKSRGLGVLSLNIQNTALLLKDLHNFDNHSDIPWVNLIWSSYYSNGSLPGQQSKSSFWWRAHIKIIDAYKAMARCNLGDGKSVFFRTDLWEKNCLHQMMPYLVTYSRKTNLTVNEAIHLEQLEDLFHTPLSQQAYME